MAFSKEDTCHFIAAYVAELAKLATEADLRTLCYLLSMAQIEADNHIIAQRKQKKVA